MSPTTKAILIGIVNGAMTLALQATNSNGHAWPLAARLGILGVVYAWSGFVVARLIRQSQQAKTVQRLELNQPPVFKDDSN